MRSPREYITKQGATLWWDVGYDLGGYNYFTSQSRPRGYYLTVQRQRNCFTAFADLDDPQGAVRVLLKEVNRRSAKAEREAEQLAEQKVAELVADYNARGVVL